MASGIARGRVCTTATTELSRMAGIIQPLGLGDFSVLHCTSLGTIFMQLACDMGAGTYPTQ